jgi:hypothetical protein
MLGKPADLLMVEAGKVARVSQPGTIPLRFRPSKAITWTQ